MKHFIKKESTQYFLKTEYKLHIIYTSVIERKTPAMCKVTEENFMKINATSSEKKCTCIIRQYYGWDREREILVLVFFQFLVSRREMGGEKREIDFLHFLPNFGQILVLFEDFSKHNQHFRGF